MRAETDTRPFYVAAAIGLRALDAREGRQRRHGADADATWNAFAAGLHTDADRLELLLRDAAVAWGPAFSAAAVFGLPGIASDEPFGATWRHRSPNLLDGPSLIGASGGDRLEDAAAALGLTVRRWTPPPLGPASRLVLGGASAVVAVARAFSTHDDLAWERQIVVRASTPAERQLAGLAAIFARASGPTVIIRADAPTPAGFTETLEGSPGAR